MATQPKCLRTSRSPDGEFVEGRIEERILSEKTIRWYLTVLE